MIKEMLGHEKMSENQHYMSLSIIPVFRVRFWLDRGPLRKVGQSRK